MSVPPMHVPSGQRGFINWVIYLIGAAIVLALAGRFVYWIATEESFNLLAGVLWTIAFVLAYLFTADNLYVARMPAGFIVFAGVSLVAMPLTWLAESRIALAVLLPVQIAFSFFAGHALSHRLRERAASRYPDEADPAWLDQRHDVVADLGTWAMFAAGAVMFLWFAPLLTLAMVSVFTDVSSGNAKWICAVWGLAAVTWAAFHIDATRWLVLPVATWIYFGVTAAIFAADTLAGPFADKSGLQVGYIVVPGALIAAFVEVFLLGGGRKGRDRQPDSN